MEYQIYTLPKMLEDEAYEVIVSALREGAKTEKVVNLPEIMTNYLRRYQPHQSGLFKTDEIENSEPFYSAAWRLCVKGILAQAPTHISRQYDATAGARFIVTEYGAKWLSNISEYDCAPTEYGRFSQLLSNHASKLGDGYHARSQEALRCYRAQTYLACCAMCGAAAESITLALAIGKKGNEEEILREYGSSGGRGKIERFLLANQDGHITRNLPNYTSLLNDWRDVAAHGAAPEVGEEEAFTALLLLLRYARFAGERWHDITTQKT